MHAKLVGVPGSHPCVSAELMLRYKGVEFTRLDLPNMTHKALLPLLRYRGSTVPVHHARGQARSAGPCGSPARSSTSSRGRRCFPAEDRATIEGAEAWADSVLQDGVRQLARYSVGEDPEAMASFLTEPVLKIPASVMRAHAAGDQAGRAAADAHGAGDRAHVPGGAARRSWTASTRCWPRA